MGFAVDEQAELISTYGDAIDEILPYPQTVPDYHQARQHPVMVKYLQKLSLFYTEIALSLPEGGAALVVNHGGVVEMSAIACVPDADYRAFGPHAECCEGVKLFWNDGRFVDVELLRIK
jgi:hypothetical protein